MKISIQELMDQSGVKFGTSGARGLVTEMSDRICYAYTRGFLQFLEEVGDVKQKQDVAVGGDLRPSTGRLMDAVMRAIADANYRVENCGLVPSPALAHLGLSRRIPSVMVTGSHIPDDRNGIKFNKCSGELLKEDEAGITRQVVELDESLFGSNGQWKQAANSAPPISNVATQMYMERYREAFPSTALQGLRVGVYQHSAVGRDIIAEILRQLGAEVQTLGRSDRFIPVDTEAIREEDVELARRWAAESRFDALVSADGDSDRPLVADERGEWLRGDVAGILCARFLEADSVSTPVSCNTAVEKCGWFREVRRTRIGSPYVVASMLAASAAGMRRVVGYEANGGFLTNSEVMIEGRPLGALPTRDAVIVMLGVLLQARRQGKTLSQLVASLPQRFTASDRLKEFPVERSRRILEQFQTGNEASDLAAIHRIFGQEFGAATAIDRTDGVRVTFGNGEILHLRPSGNAPEFRCYTEAASEGRAREMNGRALGILRKLG
jgi:phosphomannomutase